MATNGVFQADDRVTFAYEVDAGVVAGDFVMVNDGTPGVAVTSRGDAKTTRELGNLGISVTYPSGGQGLAPTQATVATTGTWDLPVVGVTVATPPVNGTEVFYEDEALALTGTGSPIGFVNAPAEGYAWRENIAPVRIGAPN